ncbi:MAG: hypothetical protein WDN48_02655 [Pseudolabrys sp.]
MRRAGSFDRAAASKPRREISGIEAVASGCRIDRHHDFRHRHGVASAALATSALFGPFFTTIS